MLLHILNRSPATSDAYRQALTAMGPEDRLLLIEDGVQGAMTALVEHFAEAAGRLYVLHDDLEARGLMPYLDAAVEVVDMAGFVTLTEQADQTLSWF